MITEAKLSQVKFKVRQKSDLLSGTPSATLNTFKEEFNKRNFASVFLPHFVPVHCAKHNQLCLTTRMPQICVEAC